MSKKKPPSPAAKPRALYDGVATILEQARGNVVRAVNRNMVHDYWLIGREIVMELQGGEERAAFLFRANGAIYDSLGQRPRSRNQPQTQALKGRPNRHRSYVAPTWHRKIFPTIPRALPGLAWDAPLGLV